MSFWMRQSKTLERVALAKFVWFHENALDLQPSLKDVRLSFALSDWYQLARKYPPALVAMREARDQASADIKRLVERYREDLRMAPELGVPDYREFAKKSFTHKASTLVAILIVNGRNEEAAKVAADARVRFLKRSYTCLVARNLKFEKRLQ